MQMTPFKLERFFARYEFSAPYLLCSSDCESLSIGELLALEDGAAERFGQHWLGYTESQGSPELRREIATLYEHTSAEDILVCSGAEEAIFVFMNSALQADDHVIVHAPGYQSLHEVARALGCDVSLWMTNDANGWELDVDWLRDHIRPTTRAIIVNCPHNPTGYKMSANTQHAILDIAREHGIVVFSDEVYRGLEHNAADRLPAECDLYDHAVSLGVMSKTYGLAGLRIGWIATRNRDLFRRMAAFKDYTTICNSAPSEFLAAVALRQRESIVRRNLDIIHGNLRRLDEFFASHEELFVWQRPNAGSTAFPRLRAESGVEAFCIDVVEQSGVLLLPSTCFDYGDRHFRVGYGRKNLPDALEHFEEYLTTQRA